MAKTWNIPISWLMFGTLEIEANTLQEAYDIALDDATGLPTNGEYVSGSALLGDGTIEEIRCIFNNGQEDEAV